MTFWLLGIAGALGYLWLRSRSGEEPLVESRTLEASGRTIELTFDRPIGQPDTSWSVAQLVSASLIHIPEAVNLVVPLGDIFEGEEDGEVGRFFRCPCGGHQTFSVESFETEVHCMRCAHRYRVLPNQSPPLVPLAGIPAAYGFACPWCRASFTRASRAAATRLDRPVDVMTCVCGLYYRMPS